MKNRQKSYFFSNRLNRPKAYALFCSKNIVHTQARDICSFKPGHTHLMRFFNVEKRNFLFSSIFPNLEKFTKMYKKSIFDFFLKFLKMLQTFKNDVSKVPQSDLTHAAHSHSPISNFHHSPGTSETHFNVSFGHFQ